LAQVERLRKSLSQPGIFAALGAALLFGSGTPLAKHLLADVSPWLMAALLYLGSGLGLTLYRLLRRAHSVHIARGEWPWLAGANLCRWVTVLRSVASSESSAGLY
jgi:drug/metabolite transporter (DMT)-like permease